MVYGGGEARVFAAAAGGGAEVAAGVVAVAGLDPLLAAEVPEVAFSALAATAADFAVGAAAVPFVTDDGVLAFTAGIAVA